MIYVDISAAVHARAGLGRYSETLAQELIAAQPERFALFYNRGKTAVSPHTAHPHSAKIGAVGLQALAHGCAAGAVGARWL